MSYETNLPASLEEATEAQQLEARLTAYALGELDGAERSAVESELEGNPEAQALVEEVRALGGALDADLSGAEDVRLTNDQRTALFAASDQTEQAKRAAAMRRARKMGPKPSAFPFWLRGTCAAAALLLVSVAAAMSIGTGGGGQGFRSGAPEGTEWAGTAPMAGPADETFEVRWESSVEGVDGSNLPQTKTDVFPDDWLNDIADRRPREEVGLVSHAANPALPAVRRKTAGYTFEKNGQAPVAKRAPGVAADSGVSITYEQVEDNPWLRTTQHHTSTFSVDVDTASYSNLRRLLQRGQRPPASAVRIEEMLNYFEYEYAPPRGGAEQPFATHVQVAACPWNDEHRLARIALKGRTVPVKERPLSNLVFLVDVSGSMEAEDKLPLLKSGLEMLTENLDSGDRVAIVTYSGSSEIALPSTSGSEKDTILGAIRALKAGGSTNGASGIQMAYGVAAEGLIKKGVNRVILCTDGDFNVGASSDNALVSLIREKRKTGVFLSVLGFGTGNYKDAKMEALSNHGNGNYAYLDSLKEAKRVLVEQMSGTLVTIAKDVKIQVFFNPAQVAGYRLIGYENRRLAARDFNNDKKDAGDIGAGHAVTALYELIPNGTGLPGGIDPNPFVDEPTPERPAPPETAAKALFRLRLRWKQPDGEKSQLLEQDVFDQDRSIDKADRDFQWASAVGAFGMLLRASPHAGDASPALILEIAEAAKGEDKKGYRAEFIEMVGMFKDRWGR